MKKTSIITNDLEVAKIFISPFICRAPLIIESSILGYTLYRMSSISIFLFPEFIINKDNYQSELLFQEMERAQQAKLIVTQDTLFFRKYLDGQSIILKRKNPTISKVVKIPNEKINFFLNYNAFYRLEEYLFNKPNDSNYLVLNHKTSEKLRVSGNKILIVTSRNPTFELFMALKNGEYINFTCSQIIFMKYLLMRVFLPKGNSSYGRNSHKEKSLPRPTYYREFVAEKWKDHFRHFLWRSAKCIQQEIKNSRYWLPLSSDLTGWKKILNNYPNKRMGTKVVS